MAKLTKQQMSVCIEALEREGMLMRFPGDVLSVTDKGVDAAMAACKSWLDDILRGKLDGTRYHIKPGRSYEDTLTDFTIGVLKEMKSPVSILIHDTARKAGYQAWIRK